MCINGRGGVCVADVYIAVKGQKMGKCANCKGTGIFVVGRDGDRVFMQCPMCNGTGKEGGAIFTKIDVVEYLRQHLDHRDVYYESVIEYVERLIQFEDLNKVNTKE